MAAFDFKKKKVLIMGLGLHGGGVGAARFFASHGARVVVTDLKSGEQLAPSIKKLQKYKIQYVLGKHREEDFKTADLIIKNPAVLDTSPILQIARKNGVIVETDMSFFFKHCKAPIIGVTGTKGKTTTAMLIGAILRAHDSNTVLAGNLRVSVLDYLDQVARDQQSQPWVVLELSSFHLESMNISPHIAAVTNIMPDHLNRYKTMRAYAKAKQAIIAHQHLGDIAVLNYNNPGTRALDKLGKADRLWFSQKRLPAGLVGVWIEDGWIVSRNQGRAQVKKVVKMSSLPFSAVHMIANACAAVAVAIAIGIPDAIIKVALMKASLPQGRMQVIREVRGVNYINDTTATIPDATIATLRALGKPKKIILIAGGVDKSVSYAELAREIPKQCKAVILLKTGKKETASIAIERLLKKKNVVEIARNMREAVKIASAHAEKGDIVLLSPAAASFGMFEHEFDRGDQFAQAVSRVYLKT